MACLDSASLRACVLTTVLFASVTACNSSETTTLDDFVVTSVSVNPENFLGDVACVEGRMRAYVATLVDVSSSGPGGTDGGTDFTLPSSAPTPCFRELRFERVVIGREYAADVQGYDRDDIVPLGCYPDGNAGCAGSPVMVDRATGAYVAPRWTTSCGRHRVRPTTSTSADAGTTAPSSPSSISADGGVLGYFDCRGEAVTSGQTPWLEGPVCVQDLLTISVRGCDPLADKSVAP